MFDKLVTNIIGGAKKHRWMFAPAVACLFILFGVRHIGEMAGGWRKHYGAPALTLLLFLLLSAVAVAGMGDLIPVPQRSIAAVSPAVSAQPGQAGDETADRESGDREGEKPFDREHPETAVTPPEPVEDSGDPMQDQQLTTVEKYVGKLKANQVTPDWAPDLLSANSGLNYRYYEKAWKAYQSLSEAGRQRLDSETLDYLLTCHRTVSNR